MGGLRFANPPCEIYTGRSPFTVTRVPDLVCGQ
jgi:hypothetical protein